MLDGELVAWNGSEPYFPLVCRRVLNRDMSIPLTFVVFDVLHVDGEDVTSQTYSERRNVLCSLGLDGPAWTTCEAFDDGRAMFRAVCELGLEGVIAKHQDSLYRPGDRSWVKIKNPDYWRRESEPEAMQRSRERRAGLQSYGNHPSAHDRAGKPECGLTPIRRKPPRLQR